MILFQLSIISMTMCFEDANTPSGDDDSTSLLETDDEAGTIGFCSRAFFRVNDFTLVLRLRFRNLGNEFTEPDLGRVSSTMFIFRR